MFRMNDFAAGMKFLGRCILLCMSLCLLFSLAPFTDFDSDGLFDSFATDGLLLSPIALAIVTPVFLLGEYLTYGLLSPKFFHSLVVPPPVF